MGRPRKTKHELHLSGMDKKNKGRYEVAMASPEACLLSTLACPTKYRPQTKRAWNSIVPTLVNLGIVSEQDVPSLTMMFKLYNSAIIADEKLEAVESDRQMDIEDQVVLLEKLTKLRNSNWAECQKIMCRFGISPTERTKIAIPQKEEASPMELLLKGAM